MRPHVQKPPSFKVSYEHLGHFKAKCNIEKLHAKQTAQALSTLTEDQTQRE